MPASTDLAGAALVTLIGIGLTTSGVFGHVGQAIAPGALLTLVGGGWLGISLARHDVRVLPGSRVADRASSQPREVSRS
jgi:hypothetical protein